MIGAGALLAFVTWVGTDANSPAVWIAPAKGPLVRAGRDGDEQQTFDAHPDLAVLLFRNRQLAFCQGQSLTWITSANGIARADVKGRTLIGWRDGEPLLFDGNKATTSEGLEVPLSLREGDKPVFATFTDNVGLLVAGTSTGTLRVVLVGPHVIAADFGRWTFSQARMFTSTSGYLLLSGSSSGSGSAVVRIAKGRIEIVLIDADRRLGVGLASDGKLYVTRRSHDDSTDKDVTDVLELNNDGKFANCCTVDGSCELIDLDRNRKLLYAVRHTPKSSSYVRINYSTQESVVLRESVLSVVPAFVGTGFSTSVTGAGGSG